MRRYELYLDNDDRLVLSEFKTIDSEYENRIFRGSETYEMIRRLASSKLVDLCELNRGKDAILEYKNYAINISDYDDVFKKRGIAPLIRNLKEFEEKPVIEKHKYKKVKRKNKYVGRKVVATGLTILMLYAVGNNLIKKEEPVVNVKLENSYSTQIKEENKIIKLSNKFVEPKEEVDLTVKDDILRITLNYPDRSDTKKANIVKSYYGDMISKYAKMYGIDPDLAIAIATQESLTGLHKTTMDPGGATGLMQIQNAVWVGKYVSAYNFETKKVESIKVTKNNIGELESNIKMGCMILQNAMEYMDHNVLAGIQCYNMGCGNLNDILDAYSKHSGRSRNAILKDTDDIGWMDFREIIPKGEPQYIEKVLSWMGENNTIKNVKRDGTLVSLTVGNQIENKKVY